METVNADGVNVMESMYAQAEAWRAADPDVATQAALGDLLERSRGGDQDAQTNLADSFSGPLTFGTAGLRAALGPGPNRMNRVVVSQAAAGFAQWLLTKGQQGGRVLIGYDARYNSDVFARDTAEIMQAAGFQALLTEQQTPTPVVAFGIGYFDCVAAVVVTASHNPPQDNGYKVYLGDGSQIIPPDDGEIAEAIAAVAARPLSTIARSPNFTLVGDELVAGYAARCAELVPADAPRDVQWVYTAMHGVGARVVNEAVEAIGFPAGSSVPQQNDPDPSFPTVAFPNPEEPGAIDLALALAEDLGVDVVVANDPDADRCALAAVIDGQWRMLSGDEFGALLGDDALRRGVDGVYANSVVSSTLLGRMAAAAGRPFTTTLTGFKWIGRVPDLAYGYEEAIGYCCDPSHVPDKDGITALVTALRLVADLKSQGRSVADRLDEITRTHGVHATRPLSVRVSDLSLIAAAMARLRANPPSQLLGEPVTVADLASPAQGSHLPPTDAIELTGERLHVVVRPSGTEPKLKCYLEVRGTPEAAQADLAESRTDTEAALTQLRQEIANILGVEA